MEARLVWQGITALSFAVLRVIQSGIAVERAGIPFWTYWFKNGVMGLCVGVVVVILVERFRQRVLHLLVAGIVSAGVIGMLGVLVLNVQSISVEPVRLLEAAALDSLLWALIGACSVVIGWAVCRLPAFKGTA